MASQLGGVGGTTFPAATLGPNDVVLDVVIGLAAAPPEIALVTCPAEFGRAP